jgi:hypothetical protein
MLCQRRYALDSTRLIFAEQFWKSAWKEIFSFINLKLVLKKLKSFDEY